ASCRRGHRVARTLLLVPFSRAPTERTLGALTLMLEGQHVDNEMLALLARGRLLKTRGAACGYPGGMRALRGLFGLVLSALLAGASAFGGRSVVAGAGGAAASGAGGGSATSSTGAGGAATCEGSGTSSLSGVSIVFPAQKCTFSLAEAAAGVTIA